MDLDDCYKKGFIRRVRENRELVKSLIEMSKSKEITVNSSDINSVSISSQVSLAYESLREILEAVSISKGYKVTSHLCLGELLKSLIKDFDFNNFDRFRYIRNGINYYGTMIEIKQGKEIIKKIFEMRRDVLNKYLKDFRG